MNAFPKWGFIHVPLLLSFLKTHSCLYQYKRINDTLPRESEEGPQISYICQVGQFIWGTVGEHPVPLQAVSHRECLLISLAIKLGQWWMVCVPLPWPGMCCDTHWPAAAVVLAALLRVLPSDISYTSRWLIPLIIWTAPGMMNRWDWSVFSRTS